MTLFDFGSIRSTGVCGIVTQILPSPVAMQPPSPGTFAGIVATTFPEPGSSLETEPSDWFKIQTAPSPVARNRAPFRVFVVLVTRSLAASIRVTVPANAFVIQTEPKPAAAATPPGATGIFRTILFVVGSTFATKKWTEDASLLGT